MKIVSPSFSFERRTGALNRFLIPFVSFISMFSVSLLIGGCFYAFLSSFLKLPADHLEFFMIPVAAFILSTGLLVRFALTLMASYKLEDGRITRGYISRLVNIDEPGFGKLSDAATALAAGRSAALIKMIRLNMLPGIAEQYFDTDVYRKRVYTSPVLVKETRHTLVFRCDDGKKLRIPKVYEGLCEPTRSGGLSFFARAGIASAAVFAIALTAAAADLAILSHKTRTEYAPSIAAAQESVSVDLEQYGFELIRSSTISSTFAKPVGDRTSEVSYYYDKHGTIERTSVQLYYDASSENVEAELRAVIGSMNAGFAESDVDAFIAAVQSCISGEYNHYRISSDKDVLTVGLSGDYVDVH